MSETFNYDEAQAGAYALPELMRLADGTMVTDTRGWRVRREQLLDLFERYVYGRAPRNKPSVACEIFEADDHALNGLARRRQLKISLRHQNQEHTSDVLLYLPQEGPAPTPIFLGLNFRGNQTTTAEEAVKITERWVAPNKICAIDGDRATAASRGKRQPRWSAETVVQNGFGLATAYCGDFHEDHAGGRSGSVAGLFDTEDTWGAIGMWAWGLSRILDALAELSEVDSRRVFVMGHSRLGKTALWAGAQDERFAGVVSLHSGCGGASLTRRNFGETIGRITTSFPHWFSPELAAYAGRETELSVDQHMLLALAAPRPLLIGAAAEDLWADPRGMLLAAHHAGPAFELFGQPGQAAEQLPPPDSFLPGNPGFYYRSGPHDVTAQDWRFILDWRKQLTPQQ